MSLFSTVNSMIVKGSGLTTPWKSGLLGGGIRRVGIGAAVGGIAGGLTSEAQSSTERFGDITKGAVLGAGIGALTTRTALNIGKGLLPGKKTLGRGWKGIKMGWKAGSSLVSGALNVGMWAAVNPTKAVMLGGLGYGAYALTQSGPGARDLNKEQGSMLAQYAGTTSTGLEGNRQMDRARFLDSTQGLTLGLHAGRHR